MGLNNDSDKFVMFHLKQNLAMLGGFLWCTGNMLCGPVINLIGLSMGLLIWGSCNMVCGWASGTFGNFYSQELFVYYYCPYYMADNMFLFQVCSDCKKMRSKARL